MCSINHFNKSIFIHIPKNGGSYVAEILSKYYGFKNYYLHRSDHDKFCIQSDNSVDKHENKIHGTLIYYKTSNELNKIMNMTIDKWNSYFIFTFVRNPYQRIISGWNYINKYNISFNKFITFNYNVNSYDYWHTFMSQYRHIVDTNGKTNIHYIGKFENLENDLKIILNKIGIYNIIHKPFIKNSKEHKNYKTYYLNNNVLENVNNIIKEDLDNFHYIKINDVYSFVNSEI
jgi:hypothetical protein